MEVILLDGIEGLGERGDRVAVARGYARNYLLPRKMALLATGAGAAIFEQSERTRRGKVEKEKLAAEQIAKKLRSVSVTIEAQVGEEEKLFGSVTTQDISDALKAQGFEIDRRQIMLEEPLKVLGVYKVDVKLYSEVSATIKVWIAKKDLTD